MREFFLKILEKFKFKGDKVILMCTLLLSAISLIAVYSSTGNFFGQFKHFLLCFVAMIACSLLNLTKLSKWATVFLLLGLMLLLLTLATGGEANRGITLLGFEFQTFYFVGFLVVFWVAHFIALKLKKNSEISKRDVRVMAGVIIFFCAMIAMANISTAIILFLTCSVLLFLGNVRMKYILMLWGFVFLGFIFLMVTGIGRAETFKGRVNYYFTQDNSQGYGDQMILAKAAVARSLVPTGPGKGVIKKSLPERETDYVFATIVEELSVFVGLFIVLLYLWIFWHARKIALQCSGAFGRLLAMGIGVWFTCQALVHIGVNIQLIPATGQTLPFISRGGTSLLFSGIMVGVLLNIGMQNNIENEQIMPKIM